MNSPVRGSAPPSVGAVVVGQDLSRRLLFDCRLSLALAGALLWSRREVAGGGLPRERIGNAMSRQVSGMAVILVPSTLRWPSASPCSQLQALIRGAAAARLPVGRASGGFAVDRRRLLDPRGEGGDEAAEAGLEPGPIEQPEQA